mmetsp:Transcript_49008/g.112383  ORF Transcript_49008/g.112383 Transcript_49008/m.112383 type:complete len:290 (+) Transcript_49008:92-961(+)
MVIYLHARPPPCAARAQAANSLARATLFRPSIPVSCSGQMQMPQKGAQAEDDEYEAMTSLGHHDIHELFSSGCDKATLKKLGLLLQLLPSEIEVSHSDAKSGPKHKKKLAAHEEGKEETETPAGTSSRLFPKALASALEAAGTRGPESSAAGVSAAKRARKVGAAAECDEGDEADLDAYDQAEAEAKRARKVGRPRSVMRARRWSSTPTTRRRRRRSARARWGRPQRRMRAMMPSSTPTTRRRRRRRRLRLTRRWTQWIRSARRRRTCARRQPPLTRSAACTPRCSRLD